MYRPGLSSTPFNYTFAPAADYYLKAHLFATNRWFQYIAIGVPAEGASAEWLEPVTDAE